MRRTLITALLLLILSSATAGICFGQKRRLPTGKRAPKGEVLGLKCPEGEPNQPRPEFVRMWIGDITRKAIELPQPEHPSGAKGVVRAELVLDLISGRLLWARPLGGRPLLREAVGRVVCRGRFSPALIDGQSMNIRAFVTYKFGGS